MQRDADHRAEHGAHPAPKQLADLFVRGGHAAVDDHDTDHTPVVALRVEGVAEREHDRGRDRGLDGRGGERRRARHQPPQARRGPGRPPGQRPGGGRLDPAFQGDDAPEGHLILDGELRITGQGPDAALVGAQFAGGLFEQFAGTRVRLGRAKRCRGRSQRRAVGRPAGRQRFHLRGREGACFRCLLGAERRDLAGQ
jgi:hypothetical protein